MDWLGNSLMQRINGGQSTILQWLVGLFCIAANHVAKASPLLNMPRGVTPLSQDIYSLHMTILWICVVTGIGVFGVFIFSLFRYRKSKGAKAAHFHGNVLVETIWAVIPLLILIAMAIPATVVLIRMDNDEKSELTIKITGSQWKWQYQYLNEGVQFFSYMTTPAEQINNQAEKKKWYLHEVDNPLVVPINKKIRFLFTASDVIHSWWVPALGVKKDTIPGVITESWARITQPGTYRGQCAELCGRDHAFMPIVVVAKTQRGYETWLKERKALQKSQATATKKQWSIDDLMHRGKEKYAIACAACHSISGKGRPPLFPALEGSSIVVGQPITRHIDIVLQGIPGSAMPAFYNQLSDIDIAAIVTYERNAWDNNTGDVVQPNTIGARRVELEQSMREKKRD